MNELNGLGLFKMNKKGRVRVELLVCLAGIDSGKIIESLKKLHATLASRTIHKGEKILNDY